MIQKLLKTDGSLPVTYARMQNAEEWHEVVCSTFSRTEYCPTAEKSFRGELSAIKQDDVRIARIQSSGGFFRRDQNAIKGDRFDGHMILMARQGELRLRQGDERYLARYGEALIYRHGMPFELEIPTKYQAVSLWVAPKTMQRHCPSLACETTPRVLRKNTVNSALALTMIDTLCSGAVSQQTLNTDRLIASTLDVVSTTILPAVEPVTRDLLHKLEQYVLRNADDTEISLDRLANVVGVSTRTLNRAFAPNGTTPMRWLWDFRLTLAHEALLYSRVRNVTEAAFAFGFKDVAHFSRSFSKRYNYSPSQLLHRTN